METDLKLHQAIALNSSTVKIDVNNKDIIIDYDGLYKFIQSQPDHQSQYFEMDDNRIIFSQTPIALMKHVYFPTHFAHLGLKMNSKHIITKVQSHQLANKEIYKLPKIPSVNIIQNGLKFLPNSFMMIPDFLTIMPLTVTIMLASVLLLLQFRKHSKHVPPLRFINQPVSVEKLIGKSETLKDTRKPEREEA